MTLMPRRANGGFVIPLVLMLGTAVLIMGLTASLYVQTDRDIAVQRRTNWSSLATAESAADRVMALLSQRNNAILLGRNYDSINPKTGKNYLGADSQLNSGDEGTTSIDEWTGYNPSNRSCFTQMGVGVPNISLVGTLGSQGNYVVRAYRYDPTQQIGTLVIEGIYRGVSVAVMLKLKVSPDLGDFPGIIAFNPLDHPSWPAGAIALRGRKVLGSMGNLYYNPIASANPALTGMADPTAPNRPDYLGANWSSPALDGSHNDTVSGKLIACDLKVWIPDGERGNNLGVINTSQTLTGQPGRWTLYQVEAIDLAGTDILTVDTTHGPVRIDIIETAHPTPGITLRDSAKILNIRTDGTPPRVGDLRILSRSSRSVLLYNQTCIQNAFLWLGLDELKLLTTGAGCPGGGDTNFIGVAWVEAILNAKNAITNRDVPYLGIPGQEHDVTITPGVTSGVTVPEDVSSLNDLLKYVDWPARYRFRAIQSWQQVRL